MLLVAAGTAVAFAQAAQPVAGPTATDTHRLGLIVAPARVRSGRSAIVHIVDTRGRGAVSAHLCTRAGTRPGGCRVVRLKAGEVRLRTHVRLPRAGRWTVSLRRAQEPTALRRTVVVSRTARYRVLVTGDSMVYGIIDVLTRSVRKTGGTLQGDPHPATGITKPSLLNWPEHAAQSVRDEQPDASVVFLGAAVDSFPLAVGGGRKVDCCGPEWVAEYTRQVCRMMASYLRGGNALVFWVLLPAPRDADRVESNHAINRAILAAAATFPDGIRVVDLGPAISPGDVYRQKASYHGRLEVIREPDGIHLANAGVHIASEVILRALRREGVATARRRAGARSAARARAVTR